MPKTCEGDVYRTDPVLLSATFSSEWRKVSRSVDEFDCKWTDENTEIYGISGIPMGEYSLSEFINMQDTRGFSSLYIMNGVPHYSHTGVMPDTSLGDDATSQGRAIIKTRSGRMLLDKNECVWKEEPSEWK